MYINSSAMSRDEQYQADFTPTSVAENFSESKMSKLDENQLQIIVDLLKESGRFHGDRKLGTLLDVGCGSGVTISSLAKYFDEAVGIDVSPTQVKIADETSHPENVRFKTGTAENMPFSDSSVDVIITILALHFIDVRAFVKECWRVLKPQGVALFYSDLISELKFSENDELPSIVDEITEMNRKCYVIAEATSHPERHILDEFNAHFNAIDWPGKRMIRKKFEFPANLAKIRDYHLSVPFYERLGKGEENPVIQVLQDTKRIWGMEGVDAEAIPVRATFSASAIVLNKTNLAANVSSRN